MGAAWGMRVLGCVAHPCDTVAQSLPAAASALTDFDEVVTSADFLCLHVPLDESTRHMVGAEVAGADAARAPCWSTSRAAGWSTRRPSTRR